MKNRVRLLLVAVWIMVSGANIIHAETINLNEDELRQFIKTVIKENPQLIYETVDSYLRELKKKNSRKTGFTEEELNSILNQRIKDEVHQHNPVKGPENAPITIIEYTDFQCPYCVKGSELIQTLMQMYPGKIRHVFKNYPLTPHEQAEPAAQAAMAAHKQGKFWEYHDLLFQVSPDLGEDTLSGFAKDLKLDIDKFTKDRNSDEIAKQIAKDKEEAEKLNFTKTPGFIINGVLISGVMPPELFVPIIERLLAEQKE